MKKFVCFVIMYGVLAGVWQLTTACKGGTQKGNPQYEKSGEVVLNPGQGWILYGTPFEHSDATIALGTTGYERFDWSELNPQEDIYDWTPIDNAVAAWAQHGKQFAFGVMSVNTNGNLCCTPKWVFDKGAKYTMGNAPGSTKQEYYIPVWDDPVYVAECKKFAEALAKKYDGNPNIAFIDIRNYGNWGEMHMWPFFKYTKFLSDEQVMELLIRPYIDSFRQTQIVICDAEPPLGREKINNWVVKNGIGLRNDGIMGDQKTAGHSGNGDVIKMAIGNTPVIWEFLGASFEYLENHSSIPWNDKRFLEIIKTNKPNYIGLGWGNEAQYMLSKKNDLVREVANLMGFSFSMTSARYPDEVSVNEAKEITISVENSGVTNMLTDCVIKLVLIDDDEQLVASFETDWNAKTIRGGKTSDFTANVAFTDAPAGTYHLALGLYRNATDPRPTYNLDNRGRTSDGFYVIGIFNIK